MITLSQINIMETKCSAKTPLYFLRELGRFHLKRGWATCGPRAKCGPLKTSVRPAANQSHCGPQRKNKRVICGPLTIECGPRTVPLPVRTVSLFMRINTPTPKMLQRFFQLREKNTPVFRNKGQSYE